jgi:hypothetical protein
VELECVGLLGYCVELEFKILGPVCVELNCIILGVANFVDLDCKVLVGKLCGTGLYKFWRKQIVWNWSL